MSIVDLDKPSHAHYANSFYSMLMQPALTLERRDLYLRMGDDAEMLGEYALADHLRTLAVGIWRQTAVITG